MTIGTSIICGSFGFMVLPDLFLPNLPHSTPNCLVHSRGGSIVVRVLFYLLSSIYGLRSRSTQTGDKEIRGSSRCGFYSGFYRGPHPLSIARAPLRKFVLTVWRALPTP